jgi:hypothetical protein
LTMKLTTTSFHMDTFIFCKFHPSKLWVGLVYRKIGSMFPIFKLNRMGFNLFKFILNYYICACIELPCIPLQSLIWLYNVNIYFKTLMYMECYCLNQSCFNRCGNVNHDVLRFCTEKLVRLSFLSNIQPKNLITCII